jgi:hypothetical protein
MVDPGPVHLVGAGFEVDVGCLFGWHGQPADGVLGWGCREMGGDRKRLVLNGDAL